MNRNKIIVCVLIAIPVLFGLFLLALKNVLLCLLGVIVLLCVLLLLRRMHPEWFTRKPEELPMPPSTDMPPIPSCDEQRVYMVLAGRTDFGARRIMVNKPNYTIGRSNDNDFSINGGKISRHHLELRYDELEQVCYAVDKGSTNGTFLNSVRMEPRRSYKLVQGDHIMIDGRDFTVEYAHF